MDKASRSLWQRNLWPSLAIHLAGTAQTLLRWMPASSERLLWGLGVMVVGVLGSSGRRDGNDNWSL